MIQSSITGPSLRPVLLNTWFGSRELGIGTGFLWREDQELFLVTAGHVLSGLHAQTGDPLDEHGSLPDRVEFRFWFGREKGDGRHAVGLSKEPLSLGLHSPQGEPLWIEHPTHGPSVDVVALKLDGSAGSAQLYPINDLRFEDFLQPAVSDDVFILGFPRGISAGTDSSILPVWKRGTIASEPGVDIDGLPLILIDAATREGMSGAPVLLRRVGLHSPSGSPEGVLRGDDFFGSASCFLGVYSSRVASRDQIEAQLGHVWKKDVIQEIIGAREGTKNSPTS